MASHFAPICYRYRKVSGDTCEGGDAYRYDPDRILCPVGGMFATLHYNMTFRADHGMFCEGSVAKIILDCFMNVPYRGLLEN